MISPAPGPPTTYIPPASSLNTAAKLKAYIDESLLLYGRCVLPRGRIEISSGLTTSYQAGGSIYGAGMAQSGSASGLGWLDADKDNSTRIVYTGPNTSAAWTLTAVQSMDIHGITIEPSNGGVGIAYPHTNGWGSGLLDLHKVAVLGASVGFKAGVSSSDHNSADVSFHGCYFANCTTGLEVNHDQGVNYQIGSNTTWYLCGTAVHCVYGGNVNIRDCATYNIGTMLRIDNCGPNNGQFNLSGIRLDRDGGYTVPIVVDASRPSTVVPCRVIVDGVTVAGSGAQGSPTHYFFRQPNPKGDRHVIDVRSFCTDVQGVITPTAIGPA